MKKQKLLEKATAIQEKNGELIQFEILVLFPVDTGVLLKTLKTGIRGRPQSVTG